MFLNRGSRLRSLSLDGVSVISRSMTLSVLMPSLSASLYYDGDAAPAWREPAHLQSSRESGLAIEPGLVEPSSRNCTARGPAPQLSHSVIKAGVGPGSNGSVHQGQRVRHDGAHRTLCMSCWSARTSLASRTAATSDAWLGRLDRDLLLFGVCRIEVTKTLNMNRSCCASEAKSPLAQSGSALLARRTVVQHGAEPARR